MKDCEKEKQKIQWTSFAFPRINKISKYIEMYRNNFSKSMRVLFLCGLPPFDLFLYDHLQVFLAGEKFQVEIRTLGKFY